MRCQIQETTAQGYDLLELKRRQYNENGGLVTLTNRSSNSLYYSFILTPEDAGIYFCYFRGQASIMTLKVASSKFISLSQMKLCDFDGLWLYNS